MADYIKGWSDGLVYVYTGGNDTIEGFRSYDTLVLGKLKISSSVRGGNEDLILKFSNNGTLLLKGGYGAYTLQTVASASDVKQVNTIDVQSDKSFTGTSGRDIVHGIGNWDNQANTFTGFSNVTINTGDGEDFIETGGKNIKVDAGTGKDSVQNWGDSVTINGGADDDCLKNLGNNVSISAGAGNDTIDNNGTDSTLLGGAGNDTVFNAGRAVRNLIDLGAGNDSVQQDAPNSTVIGGNGDDFIHNDGDNSSVIGGDGKDTILNHADNATVDSGAGNDSIQNYADNVSITAGDGNDSIDNAFNENVTICAGKGDDSIVNGTRNITSSGGKVIDYFVENFGAKTLIKYASGDGNDVIEGFNATSTLSITGGSYSTLESGDDIIVTVGQGKITLKGAATVSTVHINDKAIVPEKQFHIDGTSSADNISNTLSGVTVSGLGGNDTIYNNAVNVTIYAGAGNDSIGNHGGHRNANDLIDAGDGNDTIDNHVHNVTVRGGAGNDSIYNGDTATLEGNDGDDTIISENWNGSPVTINGGAGNDKISLYSGNTGSLILYKSGDGNDTISGFNANSTLSIAGNSYLKTVSGKDIILTVGEGKITLKDAASLSAVNIAGTKGIATGISVTNNTVKVSTAFTGKRIDLADFDGATAVDASAFGKALTIVGTELANTITGGKGNDTLTGNNGANTFVISGGNDVITDYTAETDKISVDGAASVSINSSNGNAVITVGKNTLTLKKLADENPVANGKQITFIDKTGETTKTYFNGYVALDNSVTLNSAFKGTFDAGSYTNVDASAVKASIKINGDSNNETLLGGAGNDTINGSSGQNLLTGGKGNDIFIYGGGNDTITDYATSDKISLGSAQIQSFSITGKDVTFNLGTDKSLTLKDAAGKKVTFADGTKSTVRIYTADGVSNSAGTSITLNTATKSFIADSKLVTIKGSNTSGVDITGNALANTIIGGKGNNTLKGGDGADVFIVSGGNDTITDYATSDKISLGSASLEGFSVSGKDVTFNLGTNKSLTLKDAAGKKVTFADGTKSTVKIYTADGISNSAGTSITLNAATKSFTADSNLVTINGSNTSGVAISGNTKSNLLIGGNGSDTFIYNTGSGNDSIVSYDTGDKVSIVGATVTDASVKSGNVVLKVGSNTVTVKNSKEVTFVDAGGEKIFSDGIFYNTDKTAATLPVSFSAKDTIQINTQVVDASRVKKAVNISGNDAANSITGSAYNDTLWGGAGNDTLTGGKGNDIFIYSTGNDVITDYATSDKISLGSAQIQSFSITGKDVTFNLGTDKSLTLKDAAGKKVTFADDTKSTVRIYTADGVSNSAGTIITLNAATKSFTADSKLVTIKGSNTSGVAITGNALANTIIGGTGNDTLKGGDGADMFIVSGGNDTITDYATSDKISLGSASLEGFSVTGKDVTFNLGTNKSLTLKDAAGKKVTFANGTKSTVKIYTADGISNSSGTSITLNAATKSFTADSKLVTINGSNTSDVVISGNALNNSVRGGAGNDSLSGDSGNDKLYGGNGNDTLWGGAGNDSLWGNNGADTFLYSKGEGKDIIFGFDDTDMLQITGTFSASYSTKNKAVSFKVGSTASAITLKDFTATTFNVNGDSYTISRTKLVKK